MPKHYRLTGRAQLHGEVREPGYIFTLAEGELGPMRSVSAGAPEAQIADHIGGDTGLKDVPMYVALSDEEERAIEEREAAIIREADEHAAASQAQMEQGVAAEDGEGDAGVAGNPNVVPASGDTPPAGGGTQAPAQAALPNAFADKKQG